MSVAVPGHDPILFDLGTGARYFGAGWPADRPFRGTCLVSHLHWDHIQGLPFFSPLLRPGSHLDLHGPIQERGTLDEVIDAALCPPLFPVSVTDLPGSITTHEHGDDDFTIGEVRVMARLIPHVGNTLGYRLDWRGTSVAYLSDHQQPGIDVYEATDNARELCQGVDVLIHDSQYTRAEFETKADWGHCTIDYARWLATECGARALVMFHHDPLHDDEQVDALVAAVRDAAPDGLEVIGASEGLTLRVVPTAAG